MIGIFPKRDLLIASGFLAFGCLHVIGLVVYGGLFWAWGVAMALVMSIFFTTQSFLWQDSWIERIPTAKFNRYMNAFLVLMVGLIVLLRPSNIDPWIFAGTLLMLALLIGRLCLHFVQNRGPGLTWMDRGRLGDD